MRQMCWLFRFGTTEAKILHLRTSPNEAWRPYTAFPQYTVPDYRIPGGSKGWATYQKLRLAGWVLVSSSNETVNESQKLAS
ncbi:MULTISPECIES: hypothetical protein [unclassified Coleofasciculus]|uniref:hypothetical protein n=1 Tax=unclassified Coleofasciculus TaxID=2692782 RepID=UPI00187F1994|nr:MULTISPECIES: hypothetical protein [unclassified Coleofasciculus]MBE9125930.1 hypothetical protein [Coleofasciculus sp. LEGE 07081]MBE9149301.1 hypothetical protein [Coleofasciculus sp. LEGE 07092]